MPDCVRVEVGDAASARLVARDWPWAPTVGVLLLVPGVALLGWSAATGHGVEAGGAVVFAGFGAFALGLGLRGRRDVVVSRTAGGVRVAGTEGAGPWRHGMDVELGGVASVEVRDLPVPGGTAPLPDRGADLCVTDGTRSVALARGIGPRGRRRIEDAAAQLARVVAG